MEIIIKKIKGKKRLFMMLCFVVYIKEFVDKDTFYLIRTLKAGFQKEEKLFL
jgi:hypothetical protein